MAAQGPGLGQDFTGLAHPAAKLFDFGPDRRALQVRQYLVTVSHVVELAQRSVENRREIELFAAGVDRSKDLVEVQVDREPVVCKGPGWVFNASNVQDRRRHPDCSGSSVVAPISLLSADWCLAHGAHNTGPPPGPARAHRVTAATVCATNAKTMEGR